MGISTPTNDDMYAVPGALRCTSRVGEAKSPLLRPHFQCSTVVSEPSLADFLVISPLAGPLPRIMMHVFYRSSTYCASNVQRVSRMVHVRSAQSLEGRRLGVKRDVPRGHD